MKQSGPFWLIESVVAEWECMRPQVLSRRFEPWHGQCLQRRRRVSKPEFEPPTPSYTSAALPLDQRSCDGIQHSASPLLEACSAKTFDPPPTPHPPTPPPKK